MNLSELLEKRRSIRQFKQIPVTDEQLKLLIRAASLAPCAVNRQGLTYVAIRTPEAVRRIFEWTAWAGLVKPRRTPVQGKNAPMAFIAVCSDSDAKYGGLDEVDCGAAVMCMMLQAVELGLGTCWIGSVDREKVHDFLELGSRKCLYLVAVGVPAEQPVYEWIGSADSRKYYLDGADQLHVPKLRVEDVTKFV